MTPLQRYSPGDWVVYRMPKVSCTPGRRAHTVAAAKHGDSYRYFVRKFWVVQEASASGVAQIQARRGKRRLVSAADRLLAKATWWERLMFKRRFCSGARN